MCRPTGLPPRLCAEHHGRFRGTSFHDYGLGSGTSGGETFEAKHHDTPFKVGIVAYNQFV